MNKIKIGIKSVVGKLLFEYEKENNTIKDTVIEAFKNGFSLSKANLRGADLRGANLRGADLRGANLRGADLSKANLRGADLCGANLRGANLRGADMRKLPLDFINQCSRDMLFIFQCLKSELPYLREKLIAGKINGSHYTGNCACLIGSLGKNTGEGIDKVCETIPFYQKGTHNMGERWFLNIKQGDKPDNNQFSAHALMLIDHVLEGKPIKFDY